mmetsp:Transcript_15986/g.24796  ORF Transcript_15986/g.24796 Transcript_15986/m.24796 type:complete len:108 (-) Transcript_15986:437-760(-)
MEDEENLVNDDEELLDADEDIEQLMDQFPDQNPDNKDEPYPAQQPPFKDIVFEPLPPEEDVDKQCDDSTIVGNSNKVIRREDDSNKLTPATLTPVDIDMGKVSKLAD